MKAGHHINSGHLEDGRHFISFRVFYEDTDAGGIIYHANYFRFAERARGELLRIIGFEQRLLREEHGIVFVMRRAEIEYFKPAALDDVITLETHLQALGRTSMTMLQEVRRGDELLSAITVVMVAVSTEFKPVRIPAPLADAFRAHLKP